MAIFKFNSRARNFLAIPLIFSFVFLITPQKTSAQYVDIVQSVKELGGDTFAYTAAQIVLKKLTAKTVNWINSGFKGNPAYVTDPKQFFLDVGDDMASKVLSDTQLNKICSPFKAQVRIALVKNYISEDENFSCTLSKVKNNYEEFVQDFSKGGWDGWFEVTQNSGNNPFGVYLNAQSDLLKKVQNEKGQIEKEIEQGKGFLSLKRCPASKVVTAEMISQTENLVLMGNLKPENSAVWGKKVGDCLGEKETVTPGTVINDQLTKALGSKWEKLGAADEISEIMTALVTQLVEQAIGAASGLRGASQKTPTGASVADQSQNETEPKAVMDYRQINESIVQGGINCTSSSGSETNNGGVADGSEPSPNNPSGDASSSSSSNCTSSQTTVTIPPYDFGGTGGEDSGESIPPPADSLSKHPSQADKVAQAKANVLARGPIPPGDCGAFSIVKEAVKLIGGDAGLLDKPSGAGCQGFAYDIIAFPDGYIYDVLIAGGQANTPAWQPVPCGSAATNGTCASRYRAAP